MNKNKQMFFKALDDVIAKFNNNGIKETKTISLVYQNAFKLIEQLNVMSYPIQYGYDKIDIPQNIWNKYVKEIQAASIYLIETIKTDIAFNDLMTDYIEENENANKKLGQFFTPKDISNLASKIAFSKLNINDFKKLEYFNIADDCGCGAGSMILSLLREFSNVKGFTNQYYQSICVHIVDIDNDLVKIAFFQIILNSLLHLKPLGKVLAEGKNILTQYKTIQNPLIFIANIEREIKIYEEEYKLNAFEKISKLCKV